MKTLMIAAGPSRQLAGLVGGMHVFAAAMPWLVPTPYWLGMGLMPVVLGSAVYYLRRDCFRSLPHSLTALRLDEEGGCEFQARSGDWQSAKLLGSSFVTPYLTVLNLEAGSWFARHLVILPDAVNADDFRRLRVWLKWRTERTG